MKRILSFRPGVIGNESAFEAMTLIYKYLQKKFDYEFIIVKSEHDFYSDNDLTVVSIPEYMWKPLPKSYFFPLYRLTRHFLRNCFEGVHGVLTVDPTIYPQGVVAIREANILGIPVWFDASVTSFGMGERLPWKLNRSLIKRALRNVTGIIVTAPKVIERFNELGLFDDESNRRFIIMGHPVDVTLFIPQEKGSRKDGILRILVVSRMVPEKGIFYIWEAVRPILAQRNDLKLQLLGVGPMRAYLEQEVKEAGLTSKVEFIGNRPHNELSKVIGEADIFVNHSIDNFYWEEYFGVVNLEAMACGVPVITSRAGAITYTIREKDVALFVEPRNIIELRENVIHLIESEKKRKTLGENGRRYVLENYSLEKIGEKYHKMLEGK